MSYQDLVSGFISHGRYLRDWSPRTIHTYQQGLEAFRRAVGDGSAATPSRRCLDAFVICLRERGLTPGGCNMYIRTVNSFMTWLHEQGHTPEHLRVKLLPNPPRAFRTFSDADVKAILALKPRHPSYQRTWTLILCLMDTGLRIDEALGLQQRDVDFDNLMLKVLGKGNKERFVPFSLEMRKHFYRHTQKKPGRFVFSTRDGGRLMYRNTYRQIKELCAMAGIEGEHVHPHNFRHFFAVSYLRRTNDIYRLSRILGHTSVSTTTLYLRSMTAEQIAEKHHSPLMRMG